MSTTAVTGSSIALNDITPIDLPDPVGAEETNATTGGSSTGARTTLGYVTRALPLVGFIRFGVAAWHRIKLANCASPIPGETNVDGARSVEELKKGYNQLMWKCLAESILPGIGTAISAVRERNKSLPAANYEEAVGCTGRCHDAYMQALAGPTMKSLLADEKALRTAANQ